MSAPALGFIKMSLFVQYYYLFGVMRYIRISVWVYNEATVANNLLIVSRAWRADYRNIDHNILPLHIDRCFRYEQPMARRVASRRHCFMALL